MTAPQSRYVHVLLSAGLVALAACSSAKDPAGGDGEDEVDAAAIDAASAKDARVTPMHDAARGAGGTAGADAAGPPETGGSPGSGGSVTEPDAGLQPGAGGTTATSDALETVQVGATGTAMFTTSLGMGEIFLLKASGVIDFGGTKVDAEYASSGSMGDDLSGTDDVGVDIGMKQWHAGIHTTPAAAGPDRAKWFGGYREDHTYYMTVTGEGHALSLKLVKPASAAGAGTGTIAVALLKLFPAPPKIGAELETVMIPVTKTVVASTMSTQAGKLYILQAAGRGKVGGGGTHEGDAEYMDWDEAGTRKNEGEAGADFGIGVDEITVGMKGANGASYQPRMRWWGLWRMDHTYYMVFAGTGKPIQFLYFDSGYGDNAADARLTVKIFAAP
jgi:hypothetical protein